MKSLDKFELFIFDLNETLVDSKVHIVAFLNLALKQKGYKQVEQDNTFRLIGKPLEEMCLPNT